MRTINISIARRMGEHYEKTQPRQVQGLPSKLYHLPSMKYQEIPEQRKINVLDSVASWGSKEIK